MKENIEYKDLIDALKNNKNYMKDYVDVYGIGYKSCGETFFQPIAFDNVDEAFDYYKEHYLGTGFMVFRMTYNPYGGIDIGWENGTICYRDDIYYK